VADVKTQQITLNQKVSDLESDLARKTKDLEEVTRDRDTLVKEARDKSDAMTESLLANNQQARQLWEEKLKDLQRQNVKLE
jgi:hypothetical protein